MYASSRDIRFTKKEAKRFIHILVQSMEFTIIDDIVVDISTELHNIFIRKSNTSTKSFNSIINRVKKFPTDFGLDMKFVSKKGNYYHRAYGKGLGDEGKQYLYDEMKNQLIDSMNDVWSGRDKMQMIIKMSESNVPSYVIHDLVSFMKQIGCIDIDITNYEDKDSNINFDTGIKPNFESDANEKLIQSMHDAAYTLNHMSNSSNLLISNTNDTLMKINQNIDRINATNDSSVMKINQTLDRIDKSIDNLSRVIDKFNNKSEASHLIDTSNVVIDNHRF